METVVGMVVQSKKGRDVTGWYVVLGQQCEKNTRRLVLANGEKWTLENPKLKNPLHVQVTKTVFCADLLDTNVKLKKALKDYVNGLGQGKEGGEKACRKKM